MSAIVAVPFTYYSFNLNNAEELIAYKNFEFPRCKKHKMFRAYTSQPDPKHERDYDEAIWKLKGKQSIDLDVKHLFSNQWNTTEDYGNLRIFQWGEWVFNNKKIKAGYFIEITDELKDLLDNTITCGY